MPRRANIIPINDNVTLIDDAGASTCYLVTGEKRALLIDTLNGEEDLKQIVSELTKLPVTVVNTHGHGDHILGNVFFEEAYLHPADWALHDAHFSFPQTVAELQKKGLKPCKLLPLKEDAVFDLGGLTLEVVPIPGHTAGSVALLLREHKMLFTGDALNGHLWMQLDESLSMETLKRSLEIVIDKYRKDFDFVLTGHGKGPEDASLADELAEGVIDLLDGEREHDRPYEWFMGTDMAHPFGKSKEHVIIYSKSKLDHDRGVLKPYPPIRHIPNNPSQAGMADITQNIVFSTVEGQELGLALILPWGAKEAPAPLPLIVFVQGSAWTTPNFGYEMGQMAWYAAHNIAVAMVTHRNCLQGHPFPAYLQDVKTAIRFLRGHAQEYNIDKNRVGIYGTSSGGNTALLVGLTGDDPAYKTQEHALESDAVSLVIECFGPTDLRWITWGGIPEGPHGDIFRGLTQGKDIKQVFHDMSPVSRVKEGANYPPMLLIHGSADDVVPYDQMERMYRILWDNGADVRAICVDGAPHEGSFWSRELHEIILGYIKEKL